MKGVPILLVTDGVLMPGTRMKIPVRTPTNLSMIEDLLLNKPDMKNKTIVVAYKQNVDSKKAFPIGTSAKIDKIICWSTNNSRIQYTLHLIGITRVEITDINGYFCQFKHLYNVCCEPISKNDELQFLDAIKKLLLFLTRENHASLIFLKELMTNLSESQIEELTDLCMAMIPGVPYSIQLEFLAELDVAKRMKTVIEQVNRIFRAKNISVVEINGLQSKKIDDNGLEKIKKSRKISPERKIMRRSTDIDEILAKLETARVPEPYKEQILMEYEKYKSMASTSPEHTVLRSWLQFAVSLPWSFSTVDKNDLAKSRAIFEAEHEGMEEVKKRILEFLAVRKLKNDLKGPILCLAGPPGVGKTSIAKSIANTLERRFQRIALGGIRDQSDIRGHRRTYVGAMPGRILTALKLAKCNNPVILLDEIDKLGAGPQGDPSAALLEVLDPEQNNSFTDLYLNMPFDLSKVLFIATANDINNVSKALRDRMEVIEMSSYSTMEKVKIAKKHIIPKQMTQHALLPNHVNFDDNSVLTLIEYTHEAGVRQLERVVGAICRNVALRVAESINTSDVSASDSKLPILITTQEVDKILNLKNKRRQSSNISEIQNSNQPGVVFGLAWTPVGGEVLVVETVLSPGSGKTYLTGNLGNVIKESIQVALSLIRANATRYDLDISTLDNSDLHVHLPAGAIGKDGPSAGSAFTLALFSQISKRKTRKDSAVTGEITLLGKILPVGGIKEKVLAAHRSQIFRIILPKGNKTDVSEIDQTILNSMQIEFVDNVHELISKMIEEPLPEKLKTKSDSLEMLSKL
uniref:Lon protease homolog n=1 Tax=Panagrolaimus sp. JU765 TaxID=591449 RepID=A0AC34REN6_9BILA